MKVTVYKLEGGRRDILVQPDRSLRLPLVLLQNVTRADRGARVREAVDARASSPWTLPGQPSG